MQAGTKSKLGSQSVTGNVNKESKVRDTGGERQVECWYNGLNMVAVALGQRW